MSETNPVIATVQQLLADKAVKYVAGTDRRAKSLCVTKKGSAQLEKLGVNPARLEKDNRQFQGLSLGDYHYQVEVDTLKYRVKELAPNEAAAEDAIVEFNQLLKAINKPAPTIKGRKVGKGTVSKEQELRNHSPVDADEIARKAQQRAEVREVQDTGTLVIRQQYNEQAGHDVSKEALEASQETRVALLDALTHDAVRFVKDKHSERPAKIYITPAYSNLFYSTGIPVVALRKHELGVVSRNYNLGEHTCVIDGPTLLERLAPSMTPEAIAAAFRSERELTRKDKTLQK